MIKIIAISDIHSETCLLEEFIDLLIRDKITCDLLIICGDISDNDTLPIQVFERFYEQLPKMFYVFGNNDNEEFRSRFISLFLECIEDKIISWNTLNFAGIGGSNITPYNTPYEFSEQQFAQKLAKMNNKIDIFISHVPLLGYFDEVNGNHVGSSAIKDFLFKRDDIRLHLFGHVHNLEGTCKLNNTTLVKVPCFMNRKYVELDINVHLFEKTRFQVSIKKF
ncbi:MAG: metallophosphoesterase [Candidatus Micrarchaeota archaeon]|nr:metallophosphoesterase [Candidatus Micrarchaeota archaeon]